MHMAFKELKRPRWYMVVGGLDLSVGIPTEWDWKCNTLQCIDTVSCKYDVINHVLVVMGVVCMDSLKECKNVSSGSL